MKITQENTNNLQAVLKVVVTPEDYQEKVDKILKDYKRIILIVNVNDL